ncbi:exodeoxyribonuclease VIII [Erwinia pyrifoliae]|uniref:exodeoxyribonuclease VIII n=1 Tax=Erwinia pyrifoliae TaxID=79967 RepID=UPI002206E47A|nr:exodeoxyribonuclease VIII [Erwinia pyrifoliae]UWS31141.1 exodeoxyribonuclease VIII [Erwinia pyrifoliae]
MSKFTGCWFPHEQAIEENGALRIAHHFEAANEKQARAKATLLFMEEFPDADDSLFELRLYPHAPDVPRPATEWDETFLFNHEWNDELGHPVLKEQPKPVEFHKLSQSLRVAVLLKFHTTEITHTQLSVAMAIEQDGSGFERHIIDAISKTPAVISMYPERILDAIDYIRNNCATTKKWPEIKAVLAGWVKQCEQTRKGGACGEDSIDEYEVIPRPYEHTHKTLDIEIAIALWAGDVNPNAPLASVTRWANGIIKDDREDWKRWSMQLRTQPNILAYDRPTIFGVVRNAPAPETCKFPESHGRYIAGYLAEHGKMEGHTDESQQNTAASTRVLEHQPAEAHTVEPQQPDHATATRPMETAASVERTGPFYYRTPEGEVSRANKLAKLETVLDQGCEEITKEEYLSLKDAPTVQQQASGEEPTINNPGNGRFTVDGLDAGQTQISAQSASNEVGKTQEAQAQRQSPAFQSIGAALEKDLAEKGDNLKIWRSVMRTDPRYTKDLAGAGFEGTSINAEYMIMRATEIFGPIGTGWGFEVMEDRMIPGAPLSEAICDDNKFVGNRILRDADGTLITELNHSIKIGFWYLTDTGTAERFEAYGATKYLYKTKHGITCDGEAQKKSLTDAIKKALSLLGFSADVWLGLYDQAEYKQENAIEFDIRNASDKAEDVTRIRKELDEKFKQNTNSMRSAVTPNEISGIASSLTRVMGVHLKAARDKADREYAKYLEGRLRRLEEVKSECLARLQEKAA